jgi:hypothetical protein
VGARRIITHFDTSKLDIDLARPNFIKGGNDNLPEHEKYRIYVGRRKGIPGLLDKMSWLLGKDKGRIALT